MVSTARKATFYLRAELLGELDRAVADGAAPSKNAFVERALANELDRRRRDERDQRWEQAARDPRLLRDIAEVERDFAAADAETARRIR